MKKFEHLGKSLSKDQQRRIRGGVDEPVGECMGCWGGPGLYSCWYTNSGCDVCERVYPNSPDPCLGPVGCGGCIMN